MASLVYTRRRFFSRASLDHPTDRLPSVTMYFGPPPLRAIRHLPGQPDRAYDPQPPPGTPLTGSARQGVRPPAPSGHHTTYRVGPTGRTTPSPLRAPHHIPGRPERAYDPQPPPGSTPLTGSARQGVRPPAPSGHHTTYRVGPTGRTTPSPLRAPRHLPSRPARAYDPQPPTGTTSLTGSARQGVRPPAPSGHHATYRVGPTGRTTPSPLRGTTPRFFPFSSGHLSYAGRAR